MNNSRALSLVILIFLFFTALVIKLVDIQIVKSEELKYYAERQQTAVEKINAERGLIYDRNGVLLAYNRNDISFYLDLRMVSEKDKIIIADKFSKVFGRRREHYMMMMRQNGKTVCIEEKAPGEKAFVLRNFRVNGLFQKEDPVRIYHYKNLASHLLGFLNEKYEGVNGVEKTFQETLKGSDGTRLIERNAFGDLLTVNEEETEPATPGDNIYLTINKTYQTVLEEELEKGIEVYDAASAVGIIMNPRNGEILALANTGDYDPNYFWKYSDDHRRDKAITDTYEPGSTFKAITMAALFDQQLCQETEVVNVENGRYRFKNMNFSDTHEFRYLTVKGILEQSSNIGTVKLVQRIPDETFYKYLRGFGFGNYTSVDLPGEVKGSLKKPNEWSKITKCFISFGYEISVTPVQMAAAFSAVINGGILYKPQIVQRITSSDEEKIFEVSSKEIRKVISGETSARMRELLVSTVENGTGTSAKMDFIKIGGKTGTSKKLINGKYSGTDYNSSFIGFFPAEDPQIVCLVLVNSPKNGKYGGMVAAPVFKDIAAKILEAEKKNSPVPNQNNQENFKLVFTNEREVEQVALTDKDEVIHNHGNIRLGRNIMPELKGLSVRDAIIILNKLGLKYKISGSGKVVEQSILAGEKVVKGSLCRLTCREKSVTGTIIY